MINLSHRNFHKNRGLGHNHLKAKVEEVLPGINQRNVEVVELQADLSQLRIGQNHLTIN